MRNLIYLIFLVLLPVAATAQTLPDTVVELEHRVSKLEQAVQSTSNVGIPLFLFGAFCALWAQNTSRNPWLWFFLGLLFSAISVLVLLYKNGQDRRDTRVYPTPLTDRFGGASNKNA